MIQKHFFLSFYFSIIFTIPFLSSGQIILEAPAGDKPCNIDTTGITIIPNGRIIKPYGITRRIAPHPFGLMLSRDGSMAVTSNSGIAPFSVTILENISGAHPKIRQIPEGNKTDNDLLSSVFMGIAISPDNKTLYVAGGQENKIFIFDISTGKKINTITCRTKLGKESNDGYIGDMVLTKDGKTLYAVDQIGFRVLVVDTKTNSIVQVLKTGRYPFGITMSPDEKKLFVANAGMFEYDYIKDGKGKATKQRALAYPAYKYGSEEATNGIKNDTIQISPLGDPNAQESFSVWVYEKDKQLSNTARIKTGFLVGEVIEGIPAVGGASPNSIVATDQYVFVSNGSNDCISAINIKTNNVIKNIKLQPDPRLGKWKGVIPFGLALSPDAKKLFVAESGINAVGVIDVTSLEVKGHIPVGWFPSKLAVTLDGKKLVVANAKGFGSGPNGGKGFTSGSPDSFIGKLMKGSVTVMDVPSDAQLAGLTKDVFDYNFSIRQAEKKTTKTIVPSFSGDTSSPIKYLIFISKENRTYDDVFGQLTSGRGDSTLGRYGMHVNFANKSKKVQIQNANVMPNHHQLAHRFAIGDNFYVDSDVSADGHRWLVNTYPNEWIETGTAAAYGGKRGQLDTSDAPGKFGMTGSSGAIYPEDYNQDGSMWEHLERNKKEFFNFGFGVEFGQGSFADSTMKYGGIRYLVNYPLPGPLYDRTSRQFPTYNMAIPDQFRASVFLKEFKEKWEGQGKDLPPMLTVQLLNDHGADERPHAGFPFRESYMSDNDLALGRIVEYLSHTKYWKNMAIVVTEDDAQGGYDHIDAHRSILMVISPYAKKDYVGKIHYSFGSIFKTFWNVLGIPYLNQYDAGATDLNDLFTDVPDYTPYAAVPVDTRVFDPQKALTPIDEKFDWKALNDSPDMDDVKYIIKDRKDDKKKVK